HQQAREAGIAPGPEEDKFILAGVRQAMDRRTQQIALTRAAMPMPMPEKTPKAQPDFDHDAEVERIRAELAAEAAMPTAVASALPAAPAPPRRSMPVAAPVSREVPSASGLRVANNQIRLSAEERDVARQSYQWLPPEKAERLYAEKKALR